MTLTFDLGIEPFTLSYPCSDTIAKVVLFLVVSMCLFVVMITLNCLRYHREILTGARYGKKLGRIRKLLHSDALTCMADDLTSLKF